MNEQINISNVSNNIPDYDFPCLLLTGLFIAALVIGSVLATKIILIGSIVVPGGVLAYSLTFACADILTEIYGKPLTNKVVWVGLFTMIMVLGLIQLTIIWPAAPFYTQADSFKALLGSSERIIIASITAYLISQFLDVWLFANLKELTQGRWLGLRNNVATIFSQLVDSVIFVTIAFYGNLPIGELIVGQWLVKIAIALLNTPFVYAGVYLIRRYQRNLEI